MADESGRAREGLHEALTEASIDGVLVVDGEGRMVSFNRRFVEMWGLPPEVAGCGSDQRALEAVLDKLVEPEAFLRKVQRLYANPAEKSRDELALKDGRVFDRYSAPIPVPGGAQPGRVWFFHDVTELKSAREETGRSEARYRALFERMTEGFAVHDLLTDASGRPVDYRFLDVNPAFERLTGLKRQDVVGRTQQQVLPGDDPKWLARYAQVALEGEPTQFENYDPILKRHYEVFAYRPAPRQFAVIFKDITERKAAEAALRDSLERHRVLEETMLQGVVHQDAEGKIISLNPAAERILGKSREELLGSDSVREEHGTIRENGERFPGAEHPAMAALRTGRPLRGVVMGVFNPKAGGTRWLSVDAVPVLPPGSDRPSEVYTVFEDITERKDKEALMRRLIEEQRTIFNSAPAMIWYKDAHNAFSRVNQAAAAVLGRTVAEMEGRSAYELLPDEAEQYHRDDMEVIVSGRPKLGIIEPLQKASGEKIWVRTDKVPYRDEHGRITGVIVFAVDITATKKLETDLKRALAEWDRTFNSISDLVFLQGKDFTITRVNKAFADAMKLQPSEIVGKKCYELLHGLPHPWPDCPFEKTRSDCLAHVEEVDEPRLGRPLLVTTSPILDEQGGFIGSVHISKDISEMRKTRAELEAKVRDLERFFRVAVDREARMIELKKEIRELKGKLER